MPGFTIFYHHLSPTAPPMPPGSQSLVYTAPQKNYSHHFFYQSHHKFPNDQLFCQIDTFYIGIDGVVLNLKDLQNKTGQHQLDNLLIHLYQKYGTSLAQQLRGEFVGFVFDTERQELLYFTNQTATRKVFYAQVQQTWVISPQLVSITAFKEQQGLNNTLSELSAYCLLTYGAILDRQTIVKDIHRLQAGEMICLQDQQLRINPYIDYRSVNIIPAKERSIIEQLDHYFSRAVYLEYQKDVEYQYQHLATLSGGLDSRMNVLLAAQMGFASDHLCFSQKGYADEKIARQISQSLNRSFHFVPLDDIPHIFDFEENLQLYDGALFYLGSAHFNHALKQVNLQKYGLIHTGMIGDGILGGLISAPRLKAPNIEQKLISKTLFPAIKDAIQQMAKNYPTEDSFHLYNRVFNLTNSSAFVCEQHSYLVSPFMYPEFIELCLSIPPALKYYEKIYIKWINQLHPEVSQFPWEKTGFRPTHPWKTQLSRYTKKIQSWQQRLMGKTQQWNMTPYDFWYQQHPRFRIFYQELYQQYHTLLAPNPTLHQAVEQLFTKGNPVEQSMVLTLLGAIHQYRLRV